MRFVKAFLRFWYDFVVGDDWKIAACVVAALGVGALLVGEDAFGPKALPVIAGAGVALAFVTSLVLDVRSRY
jgi:hypothetical protein